MVTPAGVMSVTGAFGKRRFVDACVFHFFRTGHSDKVYFGIPLNTKQR